MTHQCAMCTNFFEVSELRPDIITVIFDGVGQEFSYKKIDIKVSECQDWAFNREGYIQLFGK